MKMKKVIVQYILIMASIVVLGEQGLSSVHAEEAESNDFIVIDENGNVSTKSKEEITTPDDYLLKEMDQVTVEETNVDSESTSESEEVVPIHVDSSTDSTIHSILKTNPAAGVVIFKERNITVNTAFTNAETGASEVLNAGYSPDAAYAGKSPDGKEVIFKIAGVYGKVSADQVYVVEYADFKAKGLSTSYYKVSGGKLYHYITTDLKTHVSKQVVGYQQSYMTESGTYYSFDGHYFYDSYEKMVADYKSGTYSNGVWKEGNYNNSLNAANPYYNYYQYLSHRSKTQFTAQEIDAYIESRTIGTSKLRGVGNSLIEFQNAYGANAGLMLGVAINESGWGTSKIAMEKNNLFGHGAVDSNPYYGANGYSSPSQSVKYHGEYYVSKGYVNPWDWRYFGSHLGDKQSGMNVKYASDPYWGEKAASQLYWLEDYVVGVRDYEAVHLGVLVDEVVTLYKEPGTSPVYTTSNGSNTLVKDVPVAILGTANVNGNSYYKIQSDGVLTSNRATINNQTGNYSYTNNYVYVEATKVQRIISEGKPIDVSNLSTHNLKAISAGKNQVKLTWNEEKEATGYLIYSQKNGKYGYVGMTTTGTTFTDTTALDSDYNFYWVFPYIEDSNGKMHAGKSAKYVFAKGVSPAVTNLSATSTSAGVKLDWSASTGADGYLVYAIHPGGKYSYLGMTTRGTTFTDSKASKEQYNFYWVYPYHKDTNGKMIVGGTAKYTYGRALK